MKTSLTNGLNEELAANVEQEFRQSGLLRERLTILLRSKVDTVRIEARSKKTYENPSWAYFQADANGYERAIFELISLLSSKNDEKTGTS